MTNTIQHNVQFDHGKGPHVRGCQCVDCIAALVEMRQQLRRLDPDYKPRKVLKITLGWLLFGKR